MFAPHFFSSQLPKVKWRLSVGMRRCQPHCSTRRLWLFLISGGTLGREGNIACDYLALCPGRAFGFSGPVSQLSRLQWRRGPRYGHPALQPGRSPGRRSGKKSGLQASLIDSTALVIFDLQVRVTQPGDERATSRVIDPCPGTYVWWPGLGGRICKGPACTSVARDHRNPLW